MRFYRKQIKYEEYHNGLIMFLTSNTKHHNHPHNIFQKWLSHITKHFLKLSNTWKHVIYHFLQNRLINNALQKFTPLLLRTIFLIRHAH